MRLLYPLLFLFLFQNPLLTAQGIRTDVVSKKLLDKIAAEPASYYSVHIVLSDQVNLRALDEQLSGERASLVKRSQQVQAALQEKAAATQSGLLFFLKNAPGVDPASIHSYWIANAIFASMKKERVAELSQRDDVAWIGLNGPLELEKYEAAPAPPPPMKPNGIEPGLAVIHAPALWAMGYSGYGQVAFTNDTGVDLWHPALTTRYRGFYVPREQTWFEVDSLLVPTGNYTPNDCQYHGTHVTGTMLGLDRLAFDTIGVAFNAQWIGAPTVSPCSSSGTEDNVAAFQWSVDPDGDPNTIEDIPDVINNSWYDPSLDTIDCYSIYVPVEEAMEAIGIAVVFSAGNEGPAAMTITPPHNINLSEVSSFTVGALNGNVPSLPIAGFSSRGPSQCGGDSSILIKPEVSAPGVDVRSCLTGNKYGLLSGTSMASPHVSGAILLLKEAFPDLTGKELKTALYHTCTDLGQPGEDNTYGMGVINVMEAFNYLVAQGHLPVSPYKANDLLLVDAMVSPFSCENEVAPVVIVENAGTDTVSSFEVFYEAGTASQTYTWAGTLAPGERTTLQVAPMTVANGEYELGLTLQQPNGVADERPLNNRISIPVKVSGMERYQVMVEGNGNAVCENQPALLRGAHPESGTVEINWYDAPVLGNLLGTGEAFATPPLTQPATYYAAATFTKSLGQENKEGGTQLLTDSTKIGLVFDVHHTIHLKSVKVYAEQAGFRVFELADAAGESIDGGVINVGEIGENRLQLDWVIPPGSGYTILKHGGKPLYINTTGASFPYAIDNIVEITGTTGGPPVAQEGYFMFYDWEVEYEEPCGRIPVTVEVSPAGSVPTASFTVSEDSLNIDSNEPIQFAVNASVGVQSWHWNFGDGATSSEENPSHTYTAPGTYVASLLATSADGCTSFALDTITISATNLSIVKPGPPLTAGIAVYPNPVRERCSVFFDFPYPRNVTLHLADMTGRHVRTITLRTVQKEEAKLDVSDLEAGVYFLMVEMKEGQSVWKVVKI
ncbi:MAG: S8 family serine peptidase [Lewinellaceae bacterium]|nr:S8 family serine peptidase [Saprospiraceae bacterium]MCB9336722.1 S8 family serine peptidase [Lewinellaceae bacterium]